MNKEEIIEMAKQVGFEEHQAKFDTRFEPFAKLVVENERSKYTKLIEEEMLSIKEAATQYGVSNEDSIGMLLFCEEFARVIAEKEREACAKMVEDSWMAFSRAPNSRLDITPFPELTYVAKAIRARGQE
jgi:hypothetical protein